MRIMRIMRTLRKRTLRTLRNRVRSMLMRMKKSIRTKLSKIIIIHYNQYGAP